MNYRSGIAVVIVLSLMISSAQAQRFGRGGGGRSFGGGGRSVGGARSMGGGRSYGGSFSRPSTVSRPAPARRPTSPTRPSIPNRSAGSRSPGSVSFPSRASGAGSSRIGGSASSRIGDRQIGAIDRTQGLSNRIGDRQIGAVDRASRVGDRQIGAVDRTPGNRIGDRQAGAVDRTPGLKNRVGDRQIGAVDRTPRIGDGQLGAADRSLRDIGQRALIPGLASGRIDGSRLDSDLRNRLSDRRDQFQDNRGGGLRDRFENRDEMIADRREYMQDRMDNRQDYRDNAREDWQDWADDNRWGYGGWHHGHWHGHVGDYWDYMWDRYPVYSAFRVTAWGVNRASYLFGWGYYTNPYYVAPVSGGYVGPVYTEPLVTNTPMEQYVTVNTVASDDTGAAAADADSSSVPSEASTAFDSARAEFRSGSYEAALKSIDAAINVLPKDAMLHEFRSLTLFALGRFQESAAAIHAVLAVGPGWDWTTMSQLYGAPADYQEQLRALEKSIVDDGSVAANRLLLAYHYLTCGHNDAAKAQLEQVVKLQPEDAVAGDLLQMLGGSVPEPAPAAKTPAGPKATEADLTGSWVAKRPDGTAFELELTKQGEFHWTYRQKNETQSTRGVYAADDGVLAMELDSGGVMAADVRLTDNGFTFSQVGQSEPPVEFERKS